MSDLMATNIGDEAELREQIRVLAEQYAEKETPATGLEVARDLRALLKESIFRQVAGARG